MTESKHKRISLPQNQRMFRLFSDDQSIISNTEESVQEATYKSSQKITERGVTIAAEKSKLMAFKGGDPIRSKIVIENKIIEK
jgi:hypothetical protein